MMIILNLELRNEKEKKLVLPGFEPGTFALSARRTTNCAIAPVYIKNVFIIV